MRRDLPSIRAMILGMAFSGVVLGLPWAATAATNDEPPTAPERIRVIDVAEDVAEVAAEQRRTEEMMQERIEEVAFEKAPLDQAFDWLDSLLPVSFVVRWEALEDAGIERDTPISVHLKNLRAKQVLWMILSEAGGRGVRLAYEVFPNLVLISTREDIERDKVIRVYDVQALLRAARGWRHPQGKAEAHPCPEAGTPCCAHHADDCGHGAEAPDDEARRALPECPQAESHPCPGCAAAHELSPEDRLYQLVIDIVEPDSWVPNGGTGTAQCFAGVLVIRQGRSIHRQVEDVLNAMLRAGVAERKPD